MKLEVKVITLNYFFLSDFGFEKQDWTSSFGQCQYVLTENSLCELPTVRFAVWNMTQHIVQYTVRIPIVRLYRVSLLCRQLQTTSTLLQYNSGSWALIKHLPMGTEKACHRVLDNWQVVNKRGEQRRRRLKSFSINQLGSIGDEKGSSFKFFYRWTTLNDWIRRYSTPWSFSS